MRDAPGSPGATSATPKPTADEAAVAAAKDLAGRSAPWKSGVPWTTVFAEGVVLAVVRALLVLAPAFSAPTVLVILGALMLLTAGLSAYRAFRGRVAPTRVVIVAFRDGTGVAIGLTVVLGSLLVGSRGDAKTVAVAAVLGIGLLIYGAVGAAGLLARREAGTSFPVVALIVAVAMAIVGVLLVVNAGSGIEELKSTFRLLGVVLLVAGLALVGWGYGLKSRDATDPEG